MEPNFYVIRGNTGAFRTFLELCEISKGSPLSRFPDLEAYDAAASCFLRASLRRIPLTEAYEGIVYPNNGHLFCFDGKLNGKNKEYLKNTFGIEINQV